jgi:hypothetical protein
MCSISSPKACTISSIFFSIAATPSFQGLKDAAIS